MRLIVFLCALLLAGPLRADMAPAVPEAVLKRIKASPERFLDAAAVLIHGFGTGGSVDAAGVDRAIAFDRAGARASALRRLLAADLDGDGAVDAAELAVVAGASSAGVRGRLIAAHARADADGDGRVTPAEMAPYAEAEAQRLVDAADLAYLRAVLACDQDGDGAVSLPEVRRALAAMDTAA